MTSLIDHETPLTSEAQIDLLIAIARDRDRQAFARLFQYFAPRIKTFLMRPGLASGVAEDLAQETMLAVWRKAASFDPGRAGVSTWIFTIARNQRIDYLRRTRHLPEDAADPSDNPDGPQSAEATIIEIERDARIREALSQLSAEQAAVVRLSYFNDKPHVEIARELDIPLGTVKSRVRLAMQRLRALLDDLQ